MNRLIDIFYFIAVPIAMIAGLGGLYSKRKRWYLFSLCSLFVGAWLVTLRNREQRHSQLTRGWFKTVDELRSSLGAPEYILNYSEGDALWMYSVRSAPWNTVQWFSVYKNRILAKSGGREIGIFEKVPDIPRNEKEAALAKAYLSNLDKHQLGNNEKD